MPLDDRMELKLNDKTCLTSVVKCRLIVDASDQPSMLD